MTTYHMPWVITYAGKDRYVHEILGTTECVAFVRQTTNAPHTSLWRPGIRIQDAIPGELPSGIAIATFVNGKYPQSDDGRSMHAAIYLRHDSVAIYVLDQWRKRHEVKEREIPFVAPLTAKRSNDGSTFYVIET